MDNGSVAFDVALRANRPDVLDEVFDGEGVLVNLHRGTYYALNASATDVWRGLAPGRRPADVVAWLAACHGAEPAAVEALVAPFVAQLVDEALLVPAAAEAPAVEPELAPPAAAGLVAPALQRFDDMQDLLLLDPVHDIDLDGDGWPVKAGERVERRDAAPS